MTSRYRMGDLEEYEQEDYDEYEEEASEEEVEEDEEKEEPPSKEQQDFLKLREELKERFRQKLKNQTAGGFVSQDKKRTTTNDKFGTFFGPSQPVIASRVLDESRSIRETQHIISRAPNASSGNAKDHAYTSSEKKAVVQRQQPKVVNEVKKKAQTLKDMRDYSFLLSDDADIPDTKQEQPPRKISVPSSDGHFAQPPAKSKPQISKPARPIPNGHVPKNPAARNLQPQGRTGLVRNPAARNLQSQERMGPVKNPAVLNRPKPVINPKKVVGSGNASSRPLGHKPLPSKAPSRSMGTNKPPTNAMKDPHLNNKPSSVVQHSITQKNRHSEQKRPSQSLNNKPLVLKSQPSKKIVPRDRHEDRLKKSMKRGLDDDEEDPIAMIRGLFGYNPNKYKGVDEDVSDMEADFREIEKEERRSAKIARKEDEEQLRLIEEEERRERMRKKQKLKR